MGCFRTPKPHGHRRGHCICRVSETIVQGNERWLQPWIAVKSYPSMLLGLFGDYQLSFAFSNGLCMAPHQERRSTAALKRKLLLKELKTVRLREKDEIGRSSTECRWILSNSEILPFRPRQFLMAQKALENAVAAFRASQALALGHVAVQIFGWQQIAQDAAEVCDEEAPFDRRSKASENLIRRWNPYPFDRKAQRALKHAGSERRAELRDNLILNLLWVAAESARNPKQWRIGRSWIKDENGALAKLTLLDLDVDDWLRALRTLAVKQYEKLVLDGLLPFASRGLRDSGGSSPASSRSEETSGSFYERIGEEKIQALSRRERELIERLRSDASLSKAARQMNITPSTARVLFSRIKRKLRSRM
jgi:DNA-binding CsgD family transcriptional regulator